MEQIDAVTTTDAHSTDQWLPVLLLLFVGSGCAALDLRNRLVPDAGAVRRLFVRVDRRAAGHVHGRHVPRQLPAAAIHLAGTSPAEGLRVPRNRDRRHRPAAALRAAAGRSRVHGVGRLRCDRVPAAWPGGEHLPAAADAGDGRDAAGGRALGADHAVRRVVARLLLRGQHRGRRHGDAARGLLPAARLRHEHGDVRGRRDQFCRRRTRACSSPQTRRRRSA